jgi:hypothetical protein
MYLLLLPKYHYYNTPRQENKSFKVFIFSFTICSSFDFQSFLFSPLQYTVRLIFRVCHSLKFPTVRRQGLSDHVHREILRLPKPCHLFSLLHPHPLSKKKKKSQVQEVHKKLIIHTYCRQHAQPLHHVLLPLMLHLPIN